MKTPEEIREMIAPKIYDFNKTQLREIIFEACLFGMSIAGNKKERGEIINNFLKDIGL